MMLFSKAGVMTNLTVKAIIGEDLAVQADHVNIVDVPMPKGIAQHMVKSARNAAKTTILRQCVKVVPLINVIQAAPDPRKARVWAKSSKK